MASIVSKARFTLDPTIVECLEDIEKQCQQGDFSSLGREIHDLNHHVIDNSRGHWREQQVEYLRLLTELRFTHQAPAAFR